MAIRVVSDTRGPVITLNGGLPTLRLKGHNFEWRITSPTIVHVCFAERIAIRFAMRLADSVIKAKHRVVIVEH